MRKRYEEGDYLFDGFAHRPYNEQMDGWRNALPDPADYPAVQHANAVLDMFEELCAARERIWRLEKEVKMYKPLCDFYVGSPVSEKVPHD